MLILGIDTSCDDTSLAVIDDRKNIRAQIVSSQVDLHKVFGGVVPEIASRKHVELIDSLFREVLLSAGVTPSELDLLP
jgi:N6-L-threonylcarbamoyladenine synthase